MRAALAATLLLAAAPSRAGCWAVYDQSLRSAMAGWGYSVGERAASFSTLGECRAAVADAVAANPGDAYIARTRCECDGSGGGGGASFSSGGSFEQQMVGMVMGAFFNALSASLKAPPGPSAEALRAEAQRRWEALERARKDSEKRVEAERFASAKSGAQALGSGRPAPALEAAPRRRLFGDGTDWAPRLAELAAKRPRTPAEDAELAGLEARRARLWMEALGRPGLTRAERDALRLDLPRERGGASADLGAVLAARDALPPGGSSVLLMPSLEAMTAYGAGAALEHAGERALAGYGERALEFGDAYAAGGVAMSLAKGEKESAAAGAVNWVVGKIPGATLGAGTAQAVGQVTTSVARRSWDHFLEESEKVVPGVLPDGGAAQWWTDMKSEATTGQRAVFEYLGL